MKAEGPSGSSANSPQGGKVKESVCDDSFTHRLAYAPTSPTIDLSCWKLLC